MKRNDFPFLSSTLGILLAGLILVSNAFAAHPAAAPSAQVLYNFLGKIDGANPASNLISDAEGNLYGTTEYGGAGDFYGTVFELVAPTTAGGGWKETTLYSFTDTGDGARPTDGLIFDKQGNLYGTTSDSNAGGYGEVFRLAPPTANGGSWTETVLYHFQGLSDGAYPAGGLISDAEGNLYGTTSSSVFELSPPAQPGGTWTFTLLHEFEGGTSDGNASRAGLVRDSLGNLYGTTLWGGYEGNADCGSIGCGTVFEVSPPAANGGAWSEQIIHFFGMGDDGFDPEGGLTLDAAGNLYGTTYSGGTIGGGTAFKLSPSGSPEGGWSEEIIHSFAYSTSDGAAPVASMILDQAGNLYGTTLFGGTPCVYNGADYGCGSVFKLAPVAGSAAWKESILYFFPRKGGNPRQPGASLLLDNRGDLYGTTVGGGRFTCTFDEGDGCGTVFALVR
ncbi:MAG: choice-of-anchor tandem repeat GloVer-containing protein [Candidatus Sulfotelmatobacter sp.]